MSTLQCEACNAPIPNDARFCGRCGKYIDMDRVDTKPLSIEQDAPTLLTDDLSTVQDDWNWQRVEQDATAPFSLEVALSPLAGAGFGPSPAGVPVVQGSPQIGGVPSIQGTPQVPGPGGAMPHAPAPLQQAPAGMAGSSAAPNAPPVNDKHIPEHHQQRRWFRRRHTEKPHHQPSHRLHHSGQLHHSGPLHTHSHGLHERTGRMARKGLKHAGRWHTRSVLMAMVGVVVIGGLSALFLLPLLRGHAQSPAATLLLNGSVVPGGSIAIQGRNFTPGGTIAFTVDGRTASAASGSLAAQAHLPVTASAASLAQVVQQVTQAQAADSAIIVKSDGSFETTLQIDPHWPIGSSHVLIAKEQSSGQQARLTIVIPHPAQLTSCASATGITSIVLGPVTEGQAQPVSSGFALCTQGSGIVQWTASWNRQQAKWLQVEQNGNIQAPLSKQLTISASASGLKAGSYNALVTFTDQQGLKVALQVTLLVRPAGATACLNTSQQSLTFSATQGLASPAAQQVTLTNCGTSGSWAATAHTDDGAHWLTASPASGQLNAKASSAVSVAVASSALAQGIYTGQVTVKEGSGIAVINVTLNVQPSPKSPSCMSLAPQSLTFSATQGQANPAAQMVTVGNCGPAAGWSASASTVDGANWLTANPAKGNLSTNTSDTIFIAVSSAGLQTGTYTGQVTFELGASTQTVSVSFTIVQQQPKPCLQASSTSLPFTATQGQGDPAPQTVTLTNCGPSGSWSASTVNNSPWLTISPASSTLSAGAVQSVTISASIAGLKAGTYSDSIDFALMTSSGGTRQTVAVTLTVQPPPPCISASPGSLAFTGTQGQADPAAQTVTLTNCGADGSWSASATNSWLTISPASSPLSAGASQSVSIGVSLAGLKAGSYSDTITFAITTGTGTNQATVAVSLTVQSPAPPCLQVSSGSLTFSATQGQGDPTPQSVTLTNCGADGSWTASTANGSSWLNISPTSSVLSAGTAQSVTISPSIANLSAGTYNGTITFTLTNSGGTTQQTVTVSLTVLPPPPPPCLSITSTTPQVSSGVIYVDAGSPVLVAVSNCGSDAGTLSSTDGTTWLTDDLRQGTSLATGGTQTITISTASAAPPGSTGTVTIILTTSGGRTSVTVTVGINYPIQ